MFEWALNWLNENVQYEMYGMKGIRFWVKFDDFVKAVNQERCKRGMKELKDGGINFCRQAMTKFRKENEGCEIRFE